MKIFSINTIEAKINIAKQAEKNSHLRLNQNNVKLNNLPCDTVSFGKKKNNKVPLLQDGQTLLYHRLYNDLKNIADLPCVYCGEPMLSVPNRRKLVADLSTQCGEKLINTIEKNQHFFRAHKANVAKKIIKIAQKYPEDNIEELFKKLTPEYRTELENEQLEVIRRINNLYSKSFPSEVEKKLFQNILYETNQWITNKDESEPFKRKAFIIELKKILNLPIFSNKQLTKKIITEAETLPQSIESENAFVVKYHRRSAREIAELLVYEPMSTIEHIKPHQSGGPTTPQNLAVACARCNNYVRNNMPMDKFVDLHPEINKNLRRNFDAILVYSARQNKALYKKLAEKNIDNENYQRYLQIIKDNEDYKNYIKEIAQTYMRESKGKLDLNKYVQNN